jgi:glycosyltransferase involved in cell wall biosynthesis
MTDASVSVVVPTFNRAGSLDRLLHAIACCEQPSGGFDVIVVDDGSTDQTAEVVERHPGVRYLRQQNSGPATARNRGWRSAQGDVVVFTDDDTLPDRRWLVELVEDLGSMDAVGGQVRPLVPGYLADFVQLEQHVSHGVDDDGVRYLVTANCAWRRRALEELEGFDEGFSDASGEDTDLTLRARAAGLSLGVTPRAAVAHDNRTSLRGLMRTYFKHGRSRRAVVVANPSAGWGARRRSMLGPAYWLRRYRYYRAAGVSRARALGYVALRLIGLTAYAAGIVVSRGRHNR